MASIFRDSGEGAFHFLNSEMKRLDGELEMRREIIARTSQGEDSPHLIASLLPEFKGIASQRLVKRILDIETTIYGPDGVVLPETLIQILVPPSIHVPVPGLAAQIERNRRATVALISKDVIQEKPDRSGWIASPQRAHQRFNLCLHEPLRERFVMEFAAAHGSGVLVGRRTVLTASHVIGLNSRLDRLCFVFGYEGEGDSARREFSSNEVFDGALATVTGESALDQQDFALIELDRDTGRDPVPIRGTGVISDLAPVYAIGHPLGMSQRGSEGAFVRDGSAATTFSANLDVYEGSSGCPVFHAETHLLEGILTTGSKPLTSCGCPQNCFVTRKCDNSRPEQGCLGERVLRIAQVASLRAFVGRR